MDELGLTEHVLPELVALRGVEQNRFHHLDVHDHTLAVLQARSAVQAWDTWGPRARAEFDPVFGTFTGFQLAQFAFGLLGVLAVTAEYGTGTLCGVPGGPHWHQHFSTGTEPLRYLAIVPRGEYEERKQ